jgi:hypothetical protein
LLPSAHYLYFFLHQWNDREYTKDEWIHNNGNVEAGKLHDGTEIAVSETSASSPAAWLGADSLVSHLAGCGVHQVSHQESGPEHDVEPGRILKGQSLVYDSNGSTGFTA